MKKKILMVEAGSEYQKHYLIEQTKQLPYEFYLLQTKFFEGSNEWVSNWFYQDKIINVSSMNSAVIYSNVFDYAANKGIRFDGIMTFWEGYVPITHYLQLKFKLPSICNGKIRQLRHKGMMRDCVSKGLMRQPKYHVLKRDDMVNEILPQRQYPLIVKPAEMAASLAVTKVCNDDELNAAIEQARTIDYSSYASSYRDLFNLSDEVLIEEYIDSDYEISVEGVVYHGRLQIAAVCQKLVQPEPFFWEYGEITPPPNMCSYDYENLKFELQSVVETLQLNNCTVHAEIRVKDGIYYFIEMGARIGGFPIPEIVSYSSGINLLSLAASVSCNEQPKISNSKAVRYAGDYSFNTIHSNSEKGPSVLSAKKDAIMELPGVKSVKIRSEVEDTIYGDMIAVADSGDDLLKCFQEARQKLME